MTLEIGSWRTSLPEGGEQVVLDIADRYLLHSEMIISNRPARRRSLLPTTPRSERRSSGTTTDEATGRTRVRNASG